MSNAKYSPVPTADEEEERKALLLAADEDDETLDNTQRRIRRENERLARRTLEDPRFNPSPPSTWKRVALLIFMVILFYTAVKMRIAGTVKDEDTVVHVNRYSKEFKFRPAASPIITEKLKNGKVRVRGSHPQYRHKK